MTRHLIPSLMLAAVAALPAATAGAAPVGVTTVLVQESDALPAGPGNFLFFGSPALNDAGQVAFLATLGGAGVTSANNNGLYRFGGAGAVQIARKGDAAPGGPGYFAMLEDPIPALNEAGQVAFFASLAGPGVDRINNLGLYRFGDAGAVQIVRTGDALPAGPGYFEHFPNRSPALNDAGQVAFFALPGGAGVTVASDGGLYRFGDAGVVPIARTGDAPPGGPGAFTYLHPYPALNDAGHVAFSAFLGGAGVTSANDSGLYRFGDAGAVPITREGDPPPAGPNNVAAYGNTVALNDAGQVAFRALLGGVGVDSTYSLGLYRFGDDGAVSIAREGDAPPAGPGNFTGSDVNFVLNDLGQVAFSARLGGVGVDSTNDLGLYRFGDAGVVPIARTGDAPPAGPGNFTSFDFGRPSTLPVPAALNDAGQVVFSAFLGGAGVTLANNHGLYLYDDMLGLIPIARKGDPFLGSTITSLGFKKGLADEYNGFNNLGQVAYSFTLANGNSGIALFTIPEPSTAALLALGGLTLPPRRSPRVV